MEQIIALLKNYKFNANEIKTIFSLCPALSQTKFSVVVTNISLLIEAGFPGEEIPFLIYNNPKFLTYDEVTLKNAIKKNITQGNLEEILKTDPFAI